MRTVLVFFQILISLSLFSQNGLEEYLKSVEINNRELMSARSLLDAQKFQNKIGNKPSNPNIAYGYLPGNDKSIGYKSIYEINQFFSFPTVYVIKNKISKKKNEINDFEYKILRQDVLLNAKKNYIELTFLLQKELEIKKRIEKAEKLLMNYSAKSNNDSLSGLNLEKIKLHKLQMQNESFLLLQDILDIKKKLENINGGAPFEITDRGLTVSKDLALDSIISEVKTSHLKVKYLNSKLEHAQMNVKLNFRNSLPEFFIGYHVENVQQGTYSGVKAGMTIPLWENDNAVKYAESNEFYIAKLYDSEMYKILAETERLFLKSESYKNIIKENVKSLNYDKSISVLDKAFSSGEISVLNYFNEISYYYDMLDQHQDLVKDYYLILTELYSYKL